MAHLYNSLNRRRVYPQAILTHQHYCDLHSTHTSLTDWNDPQTLHTRQDQLERTGVLELVRNGVLLFPCLIKEHVDTFGEVHTMEGPHY